MIVRLLILTLAASVITSSSAMDVDPQKDSFLHTLPVDIWPKAFYGTDIREMVCAILRLQQTCQLWRQLLNLQALQNIARTWADYQNAADFKINSCLRTALQMSPYCAQLQPFTHTSHIAASHQHPRTNPALYLMAGADVNHVDIDQDTALGAAAYLPDTLYLRMLIKKDADINLPDSEGNTPLHHAVQCNMVHNVELLLQLNANKNIQNKSAEKPLACVMWSTAARHNAKPARIKALLEGQITPEESLVTPLEAGSNIGSYIPEGTQYYIQSDPSPDNEE